MNGFLKKEKFLYKDFCKIKKYRNLLEQLKFYVLDDYKNIIKLIIICSYNYMLNIFNLFQEVI